MFSSMSATSKVRWRRSLAVWMLMFMVVFLVLDQSKERAQERRDACYVAPELL